ncbi:MAG: hypothetical protein ACFFBV_08325 [Promethearchaeota archaeon]
MKKSLSQEFLTCIEKTIDGFENEKLLEKDDNRNLGIIYTPKKVVDYIVSNSFRIYFEKFINSHNLVQGDSDLEELFTSLIINQKIKELLTKIIKNIRILDPACGSGRFLISLAEKLYRFYRILDPKLSDLWN